MDDTRLLACECSLLRRFAVWPWEAGGPPWSRVRGGIEEAAAGQTHIGKGALEPVVLENGPTPQRSHKLRCTQPAPSPTSTAFPPSPPPPPPRAVRLSHCGASSLPRELRAYFTASHALIPTCALTHMRKRSTLNPIPVPTLVFLTSSAHTPTAPASRDDTAAASVRWRSLARATGGAPKAAGTRRRAGPCTHTQVTCRAAQGSTRATFRRTALAQRYAL
jgi:hypothetical protein